MRKDAVRSRRIFTPSKSPLQRDQCYLEEPSPHCYIYSAGAPGRGLSSGAMTMQQAEVKGKLTSKCIQFRHERSVSGRASASEGMFGFRWADTRLLMYEKRGQAVVDWTGVGLELRAQRYLLTCGEICVGGWGGGACGALKSYDSCFGLVFVLQEKRHRER